MIVKVTTMVTRQIAPIRVETKVIIQIIQTKAKIENKNKKRKRKC